MKADQLRGEFDHSFALGRGTAAVAVDDLLGIELGGDAHAIRLSEIAGVVADRKIARAPGRAPELLGLAGIRGAIVPAFDLAALLGYPPVTDARWLAIAAAAPVALAFAQFAHHLRVPRGSISAGSERKHIREVAHVAGRAWSVISIASVIETIAKHVKET
jgi:chemotaxis signal transduction protein